MKISALNAKVIIEENEALVDEIGNHKSQWKEYYKCCATISSQGGTEKEAAGNTVDASEISFSLRYCKKAAELNPKRHRVKWNDEIYNIVFIDYLNLKKKWLKIKCKKESF